MNRKEALEFMRRCLIEDNGKVDTEVKEAIQALVPELSESEDESMRKRIINILGNNTDAHEEGWTVYADEIAWLKKQEELKPIEIAPNQFDDITYGMQGHSTVKPAECSEDERIRKWLIYDIQTAIDDGLYNSENIEKARAAVAYLEKQKEPRDYRKLYEEVVKSDWFKENYVGKSLGEDHQPAEWSEEEKGKLNSIERLIVNANAHGNYLIGDKEAIELQHFIRSIVKPTTNLTEWSDEDKLHLNNAILAAEKEWGTGSYTVKFLKTLLFYLNQSQC